MSTIIMSAVLLVITIEVGQFGWYTRFAILDIEAKEQSFVLARSCGEGALNELLISPFFIGSTTKIMTEGACYIYPLQKNFPHTGLVTITVRGEVKSAVTNLVLTYSLGEISMQSVPGSVVVGIHDIEVRLVSFEEVSSVP